MNRVVEVAPKPSVLIESMRDIGYSLETALSDIVDNSIAAGAQFIRIIVDPSAESLRVAVVDDGVGMSEHELLEAMRAGSRSPLSVRNKHDLGRFGLGLKTASFSQCRRLTVVSSKNSHVSAATWDLDHVAATDRWEVELCADVTNIPHAVDLPRSGTLVLWEKVDRILGEATGDKAREALARRLSETMSHLSLVFHRYLAGEPGRSRVAIEMNGNRLAPYDPFCVRHPATQQGPEEICLVRDYQVRLQTFTLPHHSKMSAKEYETLAGAAGYLRNQGFYLYRERRLVIWGTWFGLARQRAVTQLTRVRIDSPIELDLDWRIDVKKASAQPPAALRERLSTLVDAICAGSKRVYHHKGTKVNPDERLGVWNRLQDKGTIQYRINVNHPIYEAMAAVLDEVGKAKLNALIWLIETGLPTDAIFADVGGDPKAIRNDGLDAESLKTLSVSTYLTLNRETTERSTIVLKMMEAVDPFQARWREVETILTDHFSWS